MEHKYTIGWYKLSEFVWRKEKQKALSIYKLLALSLQNRGLAYQLEADILMLFQDIKALELYVKSADAYLENKQIIQAISIYEHLNTLAPSELTYYLNKIELYLLLDNKNKVISNMKKLYDLAKNVKQTDWLLQEISNRENNQALMEILESVG